MSITGLNALKMKYSDHIIKLTIQEMAINGAYNIAYSDPKTEKQATIKNCAKDLRNMSYNEFRNILKLYI